MTTRIDTVQLLADMEKTAAQLTQLIADMKGAAAQVLADKAFAKDIEFSEKSESKQVELVSQPATMMMRAAEVMPQMRTAELMSFTSIDISKIVADIKSTGLDILEKELPTITGFSEHQLTALAQQAKLVAQGIADGEITEATQEFFLKGLKEMAENFARILKDIAEVLIEKFLNAVIGILWKAIEAAIGFKLPFLP